jgi:GH25 family lysozyme M1 (1,4-beta-N-acetylmuramidase)
MRFSCPPIKCPRLSLLRATAAAALVVTVTATSAGAASGAVIGPDVSSNNYVGGGVVDWGTVHGAGGASFAFVKATEGGDYLNPKFAADFAAVHTLGMIRGTYHYARPSGGTTDEINADAIAEADFYVGKAGTLGTPGDLPPVLDLEVAGTLNPAQLAVWTHTWLNRTKSKTGRTPIVYTHQSFWVTYMGNSSSFAAYPLWLASYSVTKPVLFGGWKSYTFWQYTNQAQLAGASIPVDMSEFNGTPGQLYAMARMTLKYTSWAYVASSRSSSAVYVNALVSSDSPYGVVRSPGRSVYLQRYLNGAWQNLLMRTTNLTGVFTVGFIQPKVFQYRLVVTATSSAYGANSGSTFR